MGLVTGIEYTLLAVTSAFVISVVLVVGAGRFPDHAALLLLLGSPLLLSQIPVGAVTLDNLGSASGLLVAIYRSVRAPLTMHARRIPRELAVYPIAIICAIMLTGVFNGHLSYEGILRYACLAAIPFAVVRVGIRGTQNIIILLVSAVAVSMLQQTVTGYPSTTRFIEGGHWRYGGLVGHPNFAAYTLAIAILFLTSRNTAKNSNVVYLMALWGSAVMLTGSIAAIVVLAPLILVAAGVRASRVMLALAGGVIVLVFAGSLLLYRLSVLQDTGGISEGSTNSAGWRLNHWGEIVRIWQTSKIFGIGWQRAVEVTADKLGAHSTYLQVLVELGILGSVIVAAGFLVLVSKSTWTRFSVTALLYALATGIDDPVLLYPASLAVLLACLCADKLQASAEIPASSQLSGSISMSDTQIRRNGADL